MNQANPLLTESIVSKDGKEGWLTQNGLSYVCGVSQSTISRLLSQGYAGIAPETLEDIRHKLSKVMQKNSQPKGQYIKTTDCLKIISYFAKRGKQKAVEFALLLMEKALIDYLGEIHGVNTDTSEISDKLSHEIREGHKSVMMTMLGLPVNTSQVLNRLHIGVFGEDCKTFCENRERNAVAIADWTPDKATPGEQPIINWSRRKFISNYTRLKNRKDLGYILDKTVKDTKKHFNLA